jgi:hypothetical protein
MLTKAEPGDHIFMVKRVNAGAHDHLYVSVGGVRYLLCRQQFRADRESLLPSFVPSQMGVVLLVSRFLLAPRFQLLLDILFAAGMCTIGIAGFDRRSGPS